jgi:epoxyqueuosine reductase QueG
MADALNMIPAALACGFGELGKHGSLIHRRYGSAFRLAALSTDLPLIADAPEQFGADGFCLHCQVCRDACPPDAIHEDKQVVRGERKWYVDFDKCIPYFGENLACGICIAVCPWSRPGVAERLVVKLAQRASRR